MPPKDSLYPQDWFRLAARDFKRTEHLLNVDDPEGAGYHLQQAVENALFGQIDGEVERGLPAQGREQSLGALLGDNFFDDVGGDRLDISSIGEFGIGHDRRRIGVDQNHSIPFLFERLERLGAGVVELAGLTDDDRTGADEQNLSYVGALGHAYLVKPFKRCMNCSASATDSCTSSFVSVGAAGRGYRSIM